MKVVEYTDSWTDIAFIALCRKVSVLIELSCAIFSAIAGKCAVGSSAKYTILLVPLCAEVSLSSCVYTCRFWQL